MWFRGLLHPENITATCIQCRRNRFHSMYECLPYNHDALRAIDDFSETFVDIGDVDFLFSNEASCNVFYAFPGPHENLSETCSITPLARADAWLIFVLEDMKLIFGGVDRTGGLDTVILKHKYNVLLRHAFCDLQGELVSAL